MICSWEDLDLDFHIVSMRKSERRRLRMEQELSERRIRHRFIDAIDGDDEAAVRSSFTCDPGFSPKLYTPRDIPISGRELACTLSHMQAIRRAHDLGLRQVVVCEDDIEITNVEAQEIVGILAAMPTDAAYIQLCTSLAETVQGLAKHFIETGQLFAKKRHGQPIKFAAEPLADLKCHCTAAYIVTAAGMRNICQRFFDGCRVLFPCHEDEIGNNADLVADRFIYQGAANEWNPGYACCVPTFLIEAVDFIVHPDRLEIYRQTRSAAEFYRTLVAPAERSALQLLRRF